MLGAKALIRSFYFADDGRRSHDGIAKSPSKTAIDKVAGLNTVAEKLVTARMRVGVSRASRDQDPGREYSRTAGRRSMNTNRRVGHRRSGIARELLSGP